MKLTVLGSSSNGNCYLLHNEMECLVLEAGIPFQEVKHALDFNVRKITGVLVTHSHGDHSKYVPYYLKAGIPVFSTNTVQQKYSKYINMISLKRKKIRIGQFVVTPFEVKHDVECFGFLIEHKEIGRMLFATDTEYIKYRVKNLNVIMVECNYSRKLLNRNMTNAEHVMKGHLEFETCKDFLNINKNYDLKNVILIHLSDSNSNQDLFKKEIKEIVQCPVYVAEKGLELNIGLVPFQ